MVPSACLLVLNYLCESRRLRQADIKCTKSYGSLTAKILEIDSVPDDRAITIYPNETEY